MGQAAHYGIRLVGLDLDGTLLAADHSISARNRAAITAALEQGCRVVPATGRPLTGVPAEFLELPGVDWAVTANGATVVRLADRQAVLKFWIPQADFFTAWELTRRYDRVMDLFLDGQGYNSAGALAGAERWAPPGMAGYMRTSRRPVESVEGFARQCPQVEKTNLFFAREAERAQARRELEATGLFEVTSSAPGNLELNARDVDKGRGLLALAGLLGIGPEQVMACGDSDNDTAMLRAVGLGVAMGNALPQVKAAAAWVTGTNEEGGVAQALERFVLEGHHTF